MAGKLTVRRVTTTEGRQRLPDLIQTVYGEKSVVIFHRYGRDLAALVPLGMLPKPEVEISLNIPVCDKCAVRFPASFADMCHRPECPHRITKAARAALRKAEAGE